MTGGAAAAGAVTQDVALIWAHRLAAVIVAVVAATVIADGGPAGSNDPQGSQASAFLGVIQSFAIAPGLVVSLLVNSFVLGRRVRDRRALSTRTRVLALVEFAVIAYLQLIVLVVLPDPLPLLGLPLWGAAIGLAVAVFVCASAVSRTADRG